MPRCRKVRCRRRRRFFLRHYGAASDCTRTSRSTSMLAQGLDCDSTARIHTIASFLSQHSYSGFRFQSLRILSALAIFLLEFFRKVEATSNSVCLDICTMSRLPSTVGFKSHWSLSHLPYTSLRLCTTRNRIQAALRSALDIRAATNGSNRRRQSTTERQRQAAPYH